MLIKNKYKTIQIEKIKYLIPNRYKVTNLAQKIKTSLLLNSKESIYLSINNIILNNNENLIDVYSILTTQEL